MIIIDNLKDISRLHLSTDSVITIGTFDGVHNGHKYVINRVIETAKTSEQNSVVITFDQHPREFLSHTQEVKLLTTLAEKQNLIQSLTPDILVVLPFEDIFNFRPELFVQSTLKSYLRMSKIIVGDDFHFGKHRLGNIDLLKTLSSQLGFELEVLYRIKNNNDVISSTLIRGLLESGQFGGVTKFLGHNYFFRGVVCENNDKISQFAIKNPHKLLPPLGLYEVKIENNQNTFKIDFYKSEIRDNWLVITFKGSLPSLKIGDTIAAEFINTL
jgi:riboflavin kinase / FMN adenylyltransferase